MESVKNLESNKWINWADGKARLGVIFSDVKVDSEGNEYRTYGYSRQQASKRSTGSGAIRLTDGAIFDYVSKTGELKGRLGGHDLIDSLIKHLQG